MLWLRGSVIDRGSSVKKILRFLKCAFVSCAENMPQGKVFVSFQIVASSEKVSFHFNKIGDMGLRTIFARPQIICPVMPQDLELFDAKAKTLVLPNK